MTDVSKMTHSKLEIAIAKALGWTWGIYTEDLRQKYLAGERAVADEDEVISDDEYLEYVGMYAFADPLFRPLHATTQQFTDKAAFEWLATTAQFEWFSNAISAMDLPLPDTCEFVLKYRKNLPANVSVDVYEGGVLVDSYQAIADDPARAVCEAWYKWKMNEPLAGHS